MFEVDLMTVAAIAVVCGSLLRTLIPYIERMNEVNFIARYGISMIVSMIASFALAQQAILALNIPIQYGTAALVFAFCFIQGFGTNALINELGVDHLPKPASAKKIETATTPTQT